MVDRVFLDANVLFSAAYGSPGLARLWTAARDGRCELVASEYVVEEARRNLGDTTQRTALESRLMTVRLVAEGPADAPCPLALPDKDRPVWSAAVAAGATHLLTGDVRHFGSHFGKTLQGVHILRPATYLAGDTPAGDAAGGGSG